MKTNEAVRRLEQTLDEGQFEDLLTIMEALQRAENEVNHLRMCLNLDSYRRI